MRRAVRNGLLEEDRANGDVGGIRVDHEGKGEVWQGEAWCRSDSGLDGRESCGTCLVPVSFKVVLLVSCEVRERCCELSEMLDEAAVVTR